MYYSTTQVSYEYRPPTFRYRQSRRDVDDLFERKLWGTSTKKSTKKSRSPDKSPPPCVEVTAATDKDNSSEAPDDPSESGTDDSKDNQVAEADTSDHASDTEPPELALESDVNADEGQPCDTSMDEQSSPERSTPSTRDLQTASNPSAPRDNLSETNTLSSQSRPTVSPFSTAFLVLREIDDFRLGQPPTSATNTSCGEMRAVIDQDGEDDEDTEDYPGQFGKDYKSNHIAIPDNVPDSTSGASKAEFGDTHGTEYPTLDALDVQSISGEQSMFSTAQLEGSPMCDVESQRDVGREELSDLSGETVYIPRVNAATATQDADPDKKSKRSRKKRRKNDKVNDTKAHQLQPAKDSDTTIDPARFPIKPDKLAAMLDPKSLTQEDAGEEELQDLSTCSGGGQPVPDCPPLDWSRSCGRQHKKRQFRYIPPPRFRELRSDAMQNKHAETKSPGYPPARDPCNFDSTTPLGTSSPTSHYPEPIYGPHPHVYKAGDTPSPAAGNVIGNTISSSSGGTTNMSVNSGNAITYITNHFHNFWGAVVPWFLSYVYPAFQPPGWMNPSIPSFNYPYHPPWFSYLYA